MEFQNFSLINFERTQRVTDGQAEVICPFNFLAQSSQTLKNESVIPNFLVVVAVGHGRPLI